MNVEHTSNRTLSLDSRHPDCTQRPKIIQEIRRLCYIHYLFARQIVSEKISVLKIDIPPGWDIAKQAVSDSPESNNEVLNVHG